MVSKSGDKHVVNIGRRKQNFTLCMFILYMLLLTYHFLLMKHVDLTVCLLWLQASMYSQSFDAAMWVVLGFTFKNVLDIEQKIRDVDLNMYNLPDYLLAYVYRNDSRLGKK